MFFRYHKFKVPYNPDDLVLQLNVSSIAKIIVFYFVYFFKLRELVLVFQIFNFSIQVFDCLDNWIFVDIPAPRMIKIERRLNPRQTFDKVH